jgi:hypothetical protein
VKVNYSTTARTLSRTLAERTRIARGSLLPRGDLSKMPDPRKDALFSFPGIKDYRNNQRMAMPDYPRRYGDVLKWLSNYTIVSLCPFGRCAYGLKKIFF